MDNINTLKIPKNLEQRLLWFLYDLSNTSLSGGTYSYNSAIAEVIIKIKQ